MFPYRLRPPIGEKSAELFLKNLPPSETGRAAVSKELQNREGGALERAIREDILSFQRIFCKFYSDELNARMCDDKKHFSQGMSFQVFKEIVYQKHQFMALFHLHRSNGVIPKHCHEDGFIQMVYSVCLNLLPSALDIPSNANRVLQRDIFPQKVAFLIFLLYTLYNTNSRENVRDNAQDAALVEKNLSEYSFGKVSCNRNKFYDDQDCRENSFYKRLKFLLPPLNMPYEHGSGRLQRRTYRAPIRISQEQFVLIQRIRDLALEKMSVCEVQCMQCQLSSLSDNGENRKSNEVINGKLKELSWRCSCSCAGDVVEIINWMQHDEYFELCGKCIMCM